MKKERKYKKLHWFIFKGLLKILKDRSQYQNFETIQRLKQLPKIKALCQNCLRVRIYKSYMRGLLAFCICDGEMCPCCDCQETIKQLESGDYSGFKSPVLNWNAKTGIN